MTDQGYERTPEQCKIRMHTLKRFCRQSKGNMKKSGKGRKTCKYFEELDTLLGTRPASRPVKVIDTTNRCWFFIRRGKLWRRAWNWATIIRWTICWKGRPKCRFRQCKTDHPTDETVMETTLTGNNVHRLTHGWFPKPKTSFWLFDTLLAMTTSIM